MESVDTSPLISFKNDEKCLKDFLYFKESVYRMNQNDITENNAESAMLQGV